MRLNSLYSIALAYQRQVTQLRIHALGTIIIIAGKQFKFMERIMTFTVFLCIGNHCPCDTIAPMLWFHKNLGDFRHIVIIRFQMLQELFFRQSWELFGRIMRLFH